MLSASLKNVDLLRSITRIEKCSDVILESFTVFTFKALSINHTPRYTDNARAQPTQLGARTDRNLVYNEETLGGTPEEDRPEEGQATVIEEVRVHSGHPRLHYFCTDFP